MMQHNNMMQYNNTSNTHRSLCALAIVFTIVTIRPIYSKFVLHSRKSLEIIINIQKKIYIYILKKKNGGCLLIRVCSLIRSDTVIIFKYYPVKYSSTVTHCLEH